MGVRVAVVGGGSTYTPELVEGFVRRYDRLPVDELGCVRAATADDRDPDAHPASDVLLTVRA